MTLALHPMYPSGNHFPSVSDSSDLQRIFPFAFASGAKLLLPRCRQRRLPLRASASLFPIPDCNAGSLTARSIRSSLRFLLSSMCPRFCGFLARPRGNAIGHSSHGSLWIPALSAVAVGILIAITREKPPHRAEWRCMPEREFLERVWCRRAPERSPPRAWSAPAFPPRYRSQRRKR